jgi:hypothetical protein
MLSDVQDAVMHEVGPSAIVGVRPLMPKLVPSRVIEDVPVPTPLRDDSRDTTGASYVKRVLCVAAAAVPIRTASWSE